MANFFETLVEVLKADERFFTEDGALLRNKVYESAMNMDAGLIGLLLGNAETKKRFFADVNGTMVFDKVGFGWVVNNRQFLPDSYTRFKNRIGLTDARGDLISASGDVVLSFPYKDCVLEGGQTKDDQKRDEVFYNATLAPDEVDRLLYPKVLIGAKRYSYAGATDLTGNPVADGSAESVTAETATEFLDNDNLIIKGNNLLAISSLLKRFEGKVKCIYIDPPYNTGGDGFNYNDKFNHSTWLVFMKNRLELARKLLSNDGSIYLHLDYNEVHYGKVLMDEVFGRNCFQREIIWDISVLSGYKTLTNNWIRGHETILYYSKSNAPLFNKLRQPHTKEYLDMFNRQDEDGRWYLVAHGSKRYRDEVEPKGKPFGDVWNDIMSFQQQPTSSERLQFDGQKPETLLERIIKAATNEGDIVLDFHMGTGTTCAVAHKLKRQYIGVEQMDYIETLSIERLKQVITGDATSVSRSNDWQGGGSFVYCELAKSNQRFVDEAMSAKTDADLTALLERVIATGFISSKVNPSDIAGATADFEALSIEDKKRFILELLDKNMLYVNLCDLEDEEYGISDADKAFTRSFYGLAGDRV
ncbi:MAG: site-specific DNA-methyltransferase [Fusobacteriaceae bacterium]|jgi:adenine-specific DNA-methyltransferase|nr:site-specific DNA-methyltransferase [Fusobacteriaceae bacterium]